VGQQLAVTPVVIRIKKEKQNVILAAPPRRWARFEREVLREAHEKKLRLKRVRPSKSPHNVRFSIQPKAGVDDQGRPKVRVCGNYIPLNRVTERMGFAVPRMERVLEMAGKPGNRYFTQVDFSAAFEQCPLDEESMKWTAYTIDGAKFEHITATYGLMNMTEEMQHRMVTEILVGLRMVLWEYLAAYVDDLILATKTRRAHVLLLGRLFVALDVVGARLGRAKCEFMVPMIEPVGFELDATGLRPKRLKLEAIKAMAAPTSGKELRSFLSMARWHLTGFVPQLSHWMAPLWGRAAAKEKWSWSKECDQCFEQLKCFAASKLQVTHLDESRPFDIYTDASERAISGVVIQDGCLCRVWSRVLKDAETRYAATGIEMLAFRDVVQVWRHLIGGHGDRLQRMWTDHEPLCGVVKKWEHTNRRLERMLVSVGDMLERIDLRYVRGEDNVVADFFSRGGAGVMALRERSDWWALTASYTGQYTVADKAELERYRGRRRRAALGIEVCGVGERALTWALMVPRAARRALWYVVHGQQHLGVRGVEEAMQGRSWPGRRGDISAWTAGCACAAFKGKRRVQTYSSKSARDKATYPMAVVAIDVYGHPPWGEYLTIMDLYSSYPWVFALVGGHKAGTVLQAWRRFLDEVKTEPEVVLSDAGGEFAEVVGTFERWLTPGQHAQGNGQLERFHAELAVQVRLHDCDPEEAVRGLRTPAIRDKFLLGWAGIKGVDEVEGKGAEEAVRDEEEEGERDGENKNNAGENGEEGEVDGDDGEAKGEQDGGDSPRLGRGQRRKRRPARFGGVPLRAVEMKKRRAPAVDTFVVGDYVMRHAPARTAKGEAMWRGPYRVMRVEGERTYSLRGETKRWQRADVNDLKRVALPDDTVGWRVNEGILSEALKVWGRVEGEVLGWNTGHTLQSLMAVDWGGKQIVLPGVHWKVADLDAVAAKIQDQKPLYVVMVVPHMPCEKWFRRLESRPARWEMLNVAQREIGCGVAEADVLVDAQGHGVGELVFPIWLLEASAQL
jgi:hypothetical protein